MYYLCHDFLCVFNFCCRVGGVAGAFPMRYLVITYPAIPYIYFVYIPWFLIIAIFSRFSPAHQSVESCAVMYLRLECLVTSAWSLSTFSALLGYFLTPLGYFLPLLCYFFGLLGYFSSWVWHFFSKSLISAIIQIQGAKLQKKNHICKWICILHDLCTTFPPI